MRFMSYVFDVLDSVHPSGAARAANCNSREFLMKEWATVKQVWDRSTKQQRELLFFAAVVFVSCTIQILLPHKFIAMNFFYLPTVMAAYCLGTRFGGLTAFLSFLIIAIYATADPQAYLFQGTPLLLIFDLLIWGAFLGLTAVIVGLLCERLNEKRQELQAAYVGVLEILTRFLESADTYTKSHSVRVAELSTAIAVKMGVGEQEVETIRAGALLHDIGKTDAIDLVQRASALSVAEKSKVDSHTTCGAELVRSVGSILKETIPIILYHHHYFGGRNSQEGPAGHDLPLGARIVAVADAYDAIVTDRPYRHGRAPWEAIKELEACEGIQFDPAVVEAFKATLPRDLIEPERELHELPRNGDGAGKSSRSLDALAPGSAFGVE
jgi:putative nucleotidyltransferase with HDIG domain